MKNLFNQNIKPIALAITSGCIALFLSSCSTVTPLEPGAANVMIADGSGAHLPKCKDLGHVSAFDTNGTTNAYTSHEQLQEDQTNRLRNQTYNLGGNVLVVTKHATTYTSTKKGASVDTHEMEGDAYFCHAKILQKPLPPKAISDVIE